MRQGNKKEMALIESEYLRPQFVTIWVGLECVALLEKFVTRSWLSSQKPHVIPSLQSALSTFSMLYVMWAVK